MREARLLLLLVWRHRLAAAMGTLPVTLIGRVKMLVSSGPSTTPNAG